MDLDTLKDKLYIDYHETKKMQYAYITSFKEAPKDLKLSSSLGTKTYANLSIDDGLELIKSKDCSFAGLSSYKEPYIAAKELNDKLGRETKDINTLYIYGLISKKPYEPSNKIKIQVNYMLGYTQELDMTDYSFSSTEEKENYLLALKNVAKDLNKLASLD